MQGLGKDYLTFVGGAFLPDSRNPIIGNWTLVRERALPVKMIATPATAGGVQRYPSNRVEMIKAMIGNSKVA